MFGDPKDMIKELIYEEFMRQGKKGTPEKYEKVVSELPEFVSREDIKRIVGSIV